jgi:predicted transposase YdaD
MLRRKRHRAPFAGERHQNLHRLRFGKELMPEPSFDATLKDLVECGPRDWPCLVGLPAAPTHLVDADIATVSGAADKVLRVDSDPPYLLHLEFMAGHDTAAQPRLLHKRNILLEDRHDLAVRTVAVVLRPEADSPLLSGIRQRAYANDIEPYTFLRYGVIRVWQLSPQRLLAGGLSTLPLTPISAVTQAELPGIIKQIGNRLRPRRHRAKVNKLWAATYILLGLRYSADLAGELLRGVVSMKESTTYQAILREGWEEGKQQGLQQGLQEGLQQGREQGTVAEAKRLLLLLGENRFGPPDARTKAAVESIADVQRLEELIVLVQNVDGWHALLGLPRSRRRNGMRRSHS